MSERVGSFTEWVCTLTGTVSARTGKPNLRGLCPGGHRRRLTPPDAVPLPARYARCDDRPSLFAEVGSRAWTSYGIRSAERALVEASTTPAPVRRLTAGQVDRVLADGESGRGFAPSDEQREAVRRIFGADTRATWVVGPAGIGKTTIVRLCGRSRTPIGSPSSAWPAARCRPTCCRPGGHPGGGHRPVADHDVSDAPVPL